ncbi:hypothetical protein ACFLU6_08570 [Acidobacteriota bacterium]
MRAAKGVLLMFLWLGLPAAAAAKPSPEVKDVLSDFFKATGGLKQMEKIRNLSFRASVEAFGLEYGVTFLDDGRFRIEGANETTIFDGKEYWRSYHELVGKVPEARLAEFEEYSIRGSFFHGLLDDDGKPVPLRYVGEEKKHGQTYRVLASQKSNGKEKTYYFNAKTGLVDKLIELVDDPELRQRKNVYRFSDYQEVGDLKLFTQSVGQCITTGESIQPPFAYSEFKLNSALDEKLFKKPVSTVPPVVFKDNTLTGQVISFSQRGSLITSITEDDMAKLSVKDGDLIEVGVQDQTYKHRFVENMRTAQNIGSGDYIVLFNETPALWIVKAYVGMTSEVTVDKGAAITVRLVKE